MAALANRRWARVVLLVVHALMALAWLATFVSVHLHEPTGAPAGWVVWTVATVGWSAASMALAAADRHR